MSWAGVRSRRLAAWMGGATASGTLYTVPAGRTTIVKAVSAFNISDESPLDYNVVCSSGGAGLCLVFGVLAGLYAFEASRLWQVMEEGDELQINLSVAASSAFMVSGTELLGVPS